MGVIPFAHSRISTPSLVIQRISPLENHPVNAGRTTQDLASAMSDATSAHVRLRLRGIHPVIQLVAYGKHQRRWHVDKYVKPIVGTTCLKYQHRIVRVFTQSIRESATSRPTTNNDVIKRLFHGLILPRIHKSGGAFAPPLNSHVNRCVVNY